MTKATERWTAAIEANDALDRPSYDVAHATSLALHPTGTAAKPIQNALHGTWLGHPLHPALATLPIGAWTLAFALDTSATLGFGHSGSRDRTADVALKAGTAAGVAAAAAGLADYRKVHGRDRRTGLVHAALNTTALALSAGSLALRKRGHRGAGRAASAAGWASMMAGAYLGGHLVYRRRIGVARDDRSPEPRSFRPVARLDVLEQDKPHRVAVWDDVARVEVGVVLVRRGDDVHALGSRCGHMGGPLDEGWVQGGGLVCPWHGSRFCLADGGVLDGPATAPQSRYETRIVDGMVEIRHVPDPGDEALTPREIAAEQDHPQPASPPGARRADEVLFEHHELMRRMFEKIEAMSPEDPERRDMMRLLAGELQIHEHVEDEIFYPEVRPVSEDVPVAHAEHQQLADMLAVVLRLSPSSPEFETQLRSLHTAMNHHASSEESSMFVEARRLGDARLREMGVRIEAMLDHERTALARRTWRDVKIRLLEGP
ncbi:DUF2231 domain-containing protein [Citreimonas sp.]|uniref:DUF2231 domain-containing protein n=1 Tax=Citreimonas sp. TaxID=3036715 RepID=UPI0035C7B4E1